MYASYLHQRPSISPPCINNQLAGRSTLSRLTRQTPSRLGLMFLDSVARQRARPSRCHASCSLHSAQIQIMSSSRQRIRGRQMRERPRSGLGALGRAHGRTARAARAGLHFSPGKLRERVVTRNSRSSVQLLCRTCRHQLAAAGRVGCSFKLLPQTCGTSALLLSRRWRSPRIAICICASAGPVGEGRRGGRSSGDELGPVASGTAGGCSVRGVSCVRACGRACVRLRGAVHTECARAQSPPKPLPLEHSKHGTRSELQLHACCLWTQDTVDKTRLGVWHISGVVRHTAPAKLACASALLSLSRARAVALSRARARSLSLECPAKETST